MARIMDERRDDLDALLDGARGNESWTERFVRQGGTGHPQPGHEDAALLAERRAFYAQLPLEAVVARSRRGPWLERLASWARAAWLRPVALGALAAAAAALVVVVALPDAPQPGSVEPLGSGTRLKGTVTAPAPLRDSDASLDVRVRTATGTAALVPGGAYRADDRLSFRYSAELPWVWVGSIDADGNVSAYYPRDGARSMSVVPGRSIPLPGSVALDDYVGPERFLAVFSRAPLDGGAVRSAAQRALREAGSVETMGRLPLDETAQATFLIRKVAD